MSDVALDVIRELLPPTAEAEAAFDVIAAGRDARREFRTALRQIADPSYVGSYSDAEVVSIYRKWARSALDRGRHG